MYDLTELKNLLFKELDKFSAKGDLNSQTFELMEKVACTLKAIMRIEEMDRGSMDYSRGYERYNMPTYSGRRPMRYSGHDDYIARLEDVMYSIPDEHSKREIERVLAHMRGEI